ncbi:hypothetical protein [Gilliamella apis]|uniref:hypothetical protein n=1 Tax=Gilliamella apis TaxID=1970738 RepID=UPI00080E782B|nr:hypothetical protein [Gilliamella apis]OCG02464.1 hypothetical protein A9G19_05915 [Gilliamella apis]
MEKSFFKLPLIGCLIYFLLSILLNIFSLYLHADELFLGSFTWNVFFDVPFSSLLRFFFEHYFIDSLLVFGLLTLLFHSAHVYVVNKVNITLLIIIMSIYCIVAYFITINTNVYLKIESPLFLIFFNIAFATIRYLLEALLLYYLIEFSKSYFVKSQNKFLLTEKNYSQIHYIVFSTFSCFILLKGYILESNAFTALFSGTLHNYLATIYLFAVLLGLIMSKRNFTIFSDKIGYGKLVKSISISSILILSVIFIVFSFIDNNPSKYYIDSFISVFNNINKLLLVILLISLICLTINKTTKYYFGKAVFRKSQN